MKYAVLIDAGFIKRKLGSQSEPTTESIGMTLRRWKAAHEDH
jgi:hypothetical protein